jgi:phosphonoacetaldehyde hydrolase
MRGYKIKVKKIKAEVLIFNLLGMIVDPGRIYHSESINEVFASKGLTIKDKVIADTCGLPVYWQIVKILANKNTQSEWLKINKTKPDQNTYDQLNEAVNSKILEFIYKKDYIEMEFRDRVNKLFKKGYKIIFTSDYNSETTKLIENILKENKFNFHKIYSYSDFKVAFPHPLLCYKVAIDFNIFPTEGFVRIGDTKYHNVEAFYAGAWAVSILSTGVFSEIDKTKLKKKGRLRSDKKIKSISKKLKKSGAHYTIFTLNEVKWVIDDINYRLSHGDLPNCLYNN